MRSFIIGTDWWDDCDDAVAMRLLTKAHKRGDICIGGIVINACMEDSVRSLDGFLSLEGCDDIPIGIDLEATDYGGNPPYQKRLASHSTRYTSNQDAENCVRLYRKILACAKEPVEIVEIGFLQAFAALLESGADDISPQTGVELVRDKVAKCWVMAGKWTADGEKENNFCRNQRARAGSNLFCEKCPVPITFLGWEIGYNVITGQKLSPNDHLHQVLVDHGHPNGRSSWDPMLVLLALTGDTEKAGYTCIFGTASVDAQTGGNYFVCSRNGKHCYVVKKQENSYYENVINQMI